jgi:hypothetical protein
MAERDRDGGDGRASAVERSLEDFIARANAPSTPVVLGTQAALAEVTEIVQRMPAAEVGASRRRTLAIAGFGVAFVAGAVAVLLATRLVSSAPEPVVPAAAPPVVVQTPPPPPVVVPMPVPAAIPVAAPPAPAAAPEPAPPVLVQTAPPPPRKPARVARKAAPAAKGEPPAAPKKTGLVDPFAN